MITNKFAKELINRYAEAWVSKDADKILHLFSVDGTYFDPDLKRTLVGHSQIRHYWMTRVFEEESNIKFELLKYYIFKNTLIAEWKANFTYLPTNQDVNMQEIAIMEIENSKIISFREYWFTS